MTRSDIKALLQANDGQRVRLTFDDGVEWTVDISSVDDEGVLHSGPDGIEPAHWWTRFESIIGAEALEPSNHEL